MRRAAIGRAAGLRRARLAAPTRLAGLALLAALAGGCASAEGGAPEGGASEELAPSESRGVAANDRVVLEPADGTAVGTAVVVPGSAWEDAASSGLTMLAAWTVVERLRPELRPLGALVDVACGRSAFTFTVVAPPETWEAAMAAFLDALFQPAVTRRAVDEARGRLFRVLSLDRANPAWQARLGVRRALHISDPDSPWSRPECGVPERLSAFEADDVTGVLRRFDPCQATVAVTGPFEPTSAARALRPWYDAACGDRPVLPAPPPAAPGPLYIERNTVTAWLSVGWPFPAEVDVEAVHAVGSLLRDAVAPGLERPDVFLATYEVERHGDGGALILHLVVPPESAAGAAEGLEALAAAAARGDFPDDVIARGLRRHVGARLRSLAEPEARAARLARELALGHRVGAWPQWALDAEAVRAAAAALGPPARAVVGPREARPAVVP